MVERKKRIDSLRSWMHKEGFCGLIITGGDPHMSEYVAERWRSREYFSGFTGSAGMLVFTDRRAGLWTDFRYWLQAEEELKDSGIDLFKQGVPGVIPYIDWLASELKEGDRVAVIGTTVSYKMALEWKERLMTRGIILENCFSLPDRLWPNRPQPPSSSKYILPLSLAGQDRKEKIQQVRELLSLYDCGATFLSSLDDIAWLLNIRAMDIKMNPVPLSYCWLDDEATVLFTVKETMEPGMEEALESDGVKVKEYDEVSSFIKSRKVNSKIYFSSERNSWNWGALLKEQAELYDGLDITSALKSRKNPVEIDCFHKAMILDGVAMVNYLSWLKKAVLTEKLSEVDVAEKLRSFRAAQPGFVDQSFSSISAYGPNGALCHYDPQEESASLLKPEGLYLIDSGGQYRGATTDITRTLCLGTPTKEEIRDYTLVLKGHVALSRAQFPERTRGYQLDMLARQFLWNDMSDYGHGTGHGVGAFLNVHEGPHSISSRPIDRPLLEGTVTSNEPGIYREGKYGIRIENLIHTVKAGESEFGTFLKFETLTICPYEPILIDKGLLCEEEILWINSYHKRVFDLLSGLVEEEAEKWLRTVCAPL
ncbi:MAG: aminopeptidase P family protein [Spirochaetales bacterium]|nr:aminopeptidase P family protein [Spirochaetales bacterium]